VRASQVQEPSVADEKQNQDSPNEMMDVLSANHDPIEWSVAVYDKINQQADSEEGDEKGHGGEKHAPAGPVGDGCPDEISEFGELQQDQEHCDDQCEEEQQQYRASLRHI